jgi:hypothetical protein
MTEPNADDPNSLLFEFGTRWRHRQDEKDEPGPMARWFAKLDAACRAGNLPEAWWMNDAHKGQRIAALEAELAEAQAINREVGSSSRISDVCPGTEHCQAEIAERAKHLATVTAERDGIKEAMELGEQTHWQRVELLDQEIAKLRAVVEAAQEYRELAQNPRDDGVGELEARARLFHTLSTLNPKEPTP